MFFYDRLDNVMEKINNFTQLKDFLNQHGIHVDVVDSSEPKINTDKQSDQNNTPKNLQDLFSDILKELDLDSPLRSTSASLIKQLDGENQDSKSSEQSNSSKLHNNASYAVTTKGDSIVSSDNSSNTHTMNKANHVNINFPFAKTHSVEKHSVTANSTGDSTTSVKTQAKEESAPTQHVNVANVANSGTANATAATQSKIQDINFKMRELKRKIAVEESSANLIQLTLDLAALAEEKQKEEGSLELKQFQQKMAQAKQELDSVNDELDTLSNMFKAWNGNKSNGVKEMHGMKEMLEMQMNKLQSHFTQLKQLTK